MMLPVKKKKLKKDTSVPIHPVTGELMVPFNELLKCKENPSYWINTYVKTKSSNGGIIDFRLYEFQEEALDDFVNHRFNIFVKARQMGVSWLTAAFATWLMIFHDNKEVGCIANKERTASKMVEKVKIIITNLPDWMRDALDIKEFETDAKLTLALNNGSLIEASATTTDALVGYTLSLLIVDEMAVIENLESVWTSIFPTVQVGGKIIGISTPRGAHGLFYQIYTDAKAGLNDFNAKAFGWERHPDRIKYIKTELCQHDNGEHCTYCKKDLSWAIKEIKRIGEKSFKQEYACGFLGSGSTLIPEAWITEMEKWIAPPIVKQKEREKGLWIWEMPIKDHRYVIAADFAAGEDDVSNGEGEAKSKTDYNAFVVIDVDATTIIKDEDGQEIEVQCPRLVADYQAKVKQPVFAEILYNTCVVYNNALFIPERNSGWYITAETYFTNKYYYNIYREPKNIEKQGMNLLNIQNPIGISTTKANRNAITDKLNESITTNFFQFKSSRLLSEIKTFIYNPKNGKQRYEAAAGCHDDLVMACCIALYVIAQYLSHRDPTMADMALAALKNANYKNNYKTMTQHGMMQSPMPSITLDGMLGKMLPTNPFMHKETGVDFRDFVLDAIPKKKDKDKDNEPQRSIFDNLID